MNAKIEPLSLSVPLGLTAHAQAEKFRGYQSNPRKAKQVYLNSLAVYAVNACLQFRGFETDLSNSASWDPLMQTLMDVADLSVKNQGRLECRPVLPGEEAVWVPAEVWSERIGYVAVQLDKSLRKATVVGFAEKVEAEELPLSQLRSPEALLERLSRAREPELVKKPVKLKEWLQNVFDTGWQAVEELFSSQQPALSFRGANHLETRQGENPVVGISRAKLLDLGIQPVGEQVALMVELIPVAEQEIDLSVKVCPIGSRDYLPSGLQVMLLDEAGIAVMQAEARNTEMIQLKFSGEPGERFSVKVSLDGFSLREDFVI